MNDKKITISIPFGDKPNANGRIYKKETVKEMVNKINEASIPITDPCTSFDPDVDIDESIIKGFTNKAVYDERNNRIELDCHIESDDVKKFLESGLDIVPNGVGDLNSNVVENYSLKFFSITDNSAFKPIKDIQDEK